MARLINADTLKDEFTGNFQKEWHYTWIRAIIDMAPTVEAIPVVHGHWNDNGTDWECSNCGCDHTKKALYTDYCPHCRAKMDEESEKE